MPPSPGLFGPSTPGISKAQRELEVRKRCYQERILRGLFLARPTFDQEVGWTKQDDAIYANLSDGERPTSCDKLHYRTPQPPACGQIGRYPIALPDSHDGFFQSLARLEVVARQPERQQEVFGWVTPGKNDFAGQTAFEMAKARYWAGPAKIIPATVGEAIQEVYGQIETADFHANYLLRLLYLYGDTPPHLRTHRSTWRRFDRFQRDANFSAQVETTIRTNLLAFKYWLDEPFFADDKDNVKLREFRWSVDTTPGKNPAESDDYKAEMTFWSENHQILFATAEYLAGQLWPGAIFRVGNPFRKEGPDKTRPTDLLGTQRMERARPRILRWLAGRLRFGFSEWNSPGYYVEDFSALFNLADFCLDDEIQTRACMVLDLMMFDLARFTHRGQFGVTAGRCYFEHKSCGLDHPLGDMVEMLFGTRGGVVSEPQAPSAGALASTRRYQLPDVLMAIGQDTPTEFVDRSRVSITFEEAGDYNVGFNSDEDLMFWWSRAAFFTKQVIAASRKRVGDYHLLKSDPFQKIFPVIDKALKKVGAEGLEAGVLKVLADDLSVLTEGSALTRANLYTYRSTNVMLSSVQNFRPGQINFQTQFCQATLSMAALVWTTYPSAGDALKIFKPPHDHDGPNWWTGSATAPRVVQWNNAAIVAYKPNALQLLIFGHRTHAWFPIAAFDAGSVIQRGGNCSGAKGLWTFGKCGDGYVGLFSAQPPVWTTTGPWKDKELVADGTRNVFIFQVGNAADFGNFENFVTRTSQARIHIGGLPAVTTGEAAGAGAGAVGGAALGLEVAGPLGAIVGGVGGAIGGAVLGSKTAEDFECSYDIPGAGRLELFYDNGQVHYAGAQFSDDEFPRFENPYVSCGDTDSKGRYTGRVLWNQDNYTIQHQGHTLTHDYSGLKHPQSNTTQVSRSIDGIVRDCSLAQFGPRPFYVVGHNPNSIQAVHDALDAGANAIEPDVNVYEDRQSELCISEVGVVDTDEGGDADSPSLGDFLDQLRVVAKARPELSLVVFDCKPKVATAAHGLELLQQIRNRFTYDTQVNIIISVSSLTETAIFDAIKDMLGPREGLMVDEENDPIAVSNAFQKLNVANQSYGNGISFLNSILGPSVRPSMELACEFHAATNRLPFIYVWSVNDDDLMREYIRIGVDGMITGDIEKLRGVMNEEESRHLVRFATRADNPFAQGNFAYGLTIQTGDVFRGGTSSNITFKLTGLVGSASITVDASRPGRMGRGDTNYVTLQSDDLGDLQSITVSHDDEGDGPDWYLDRITVQSHRYGLVKRAEFGRWIDDTAAVTRPLV